MTASENQIVVYQPNEAVRQGIVFYLVGLSSRGFGKVRLGFDEMSAGYMQRIKRVALVSLAKV